MTAKWEKKGANDGVLTFTIPVDVIKSELDRTFNRVKGNINMPGFRKGHVTRQAFDKMYGEQALYEETLNALLPKYYTEAVEEAGIDPVVRPTINVESMEKGQDWVIKADVIVKPKVKLGEYKGLEVEKQNREVTDEDVENRLKSAQDAQAELVVTQEAAKNGDTVVIDFEGFKEGKAFEGGKGDNYSLELGSGSFIPGFENQLVGSKAGDDVEVNVTFPEDYQAADLAGQPATFKVKVHEVKQKEVPALDDEFAKDVDDEVNSLDELKEKFRNELIKQREEAATESVRSLALEQAVKNAEIVDLPHEMVHDEVHRSMDNFLQQMQAQGISPEMYYQITGTTEEDLHKQFEGEAEQRVRTNLVLEAIAKAEKIEPTKEEIDAEVKRLATEYNMDEAQVRRALSEDMLKQDLQMQRAVSIITDSAKEA